jgi:predicted Fe-Mo cluster-binding NifX family protein
MRSYSRAFVKRADQFDIGSIILNNKKTINSKFMKRKIAVPVINGLLNEHFGHCSHFALIDTDDKTILGESLVEAPPHQPGLLPPWLAERDVTDVIAGGMGQRAIDLFIQQNINVFVGAPKLSPKDLVKGFLNETLSFSANYCDH